MAPTLSRVHWRTLTLAVLNLPVLQPDKVFISSWTWWLLRYKVYGSQQSGIVSLTNISIQSYILISFKADTSLKLDGSLT